MDGLINPSEAAITTAVRKRQRKNVTLTNCRNTGRTITKHNGADLWCLWESAINEPGYSSIDAEGIVEAVAELDEVAALGGDAP